MQTVVVFKVILDLIIPHVISQEEGNENAWYHNVTKT